MDISETERRILKNQLHIMFVLSSLAHDKHAEMIQAAMDNTNILLTPIIHELKKEPG